MEKRRKGKVKEPVGLTPLKDELLSNSFVECNKMVPDNTTINPQISEMMAPPLWPSQS